jgi:hypothetical protein
MSGQYSCPSFFIEQKNRYPKSPKVKIQFKIFNFRLN